MARVHAVQTPVLMVHGPLDAIAPVTQVRRFARALRKRGKSHELIERGDCDHEMSVESCRLAFFERLHDFLRRRLEASSPHRGGSGARADPGRSPSRH